MPRAGGGLMGVAVSPSFERDRNVYGFASADPASRPLRLRPAEDLRSFTVEDVALDGIQSAERHHGGRIGFGPHGNLWIGTGDAFEPENAADDDSLDGKVLRIQPDGSVPEDTPDPDTPLHSSGHRNVQGLALGPDGTVRASEPGHRMWDGVNVLKPGLTAGCARSASPTSTRRIWGASCATVASAPP